MLPDVPLEFNLKDIFVYNKMVRKKWKECLFTNSTV